MGRPVVMPYEHAARCGERIRHLRERQELGLKELATKAGISFQYLSRIEKGEVNTPIETLGKIATGLGMTLEVLMSGKRTINYADTLRALADELDHLAAVS